MHRAAVCSIGQPASLPLYTLKENMQITEGAVTGPTPDPHPRWQAWSYRGKKTAVISCPFCERGIGLHINHAIAGSGAVSPSVVCPHTCSFHAFIHLLGWRNDEDLQTS